MSTKYFYNITPRERALLLQIKAEPEKYLIEKTLSHLSIFASTYDWAAQLYGKEATSAVSMLPDKMHDYASKKFHTNTTEGWYSVILRVGAEGNEEAAWNMGWEFIDEYLLYRDCVPLTGWKPHTGIRTDIPPYTDEESRDLSWEERHFAAGVKKRPGMYFGKNSFSELAAFFRGFRCGMESTGHGGEFILVPRAFDAYVKAQFSDADGTDFADVIHAAEPDSVRAITLFWELYDRYLERCGYEKLPEWERFPDSDFRLLKKGYDFHMCSLLSDSFVKVFNNAPWNDNWKPQQAFERIHNFIETPRFDGAAVIRDGKVIAAILGRGEQYFDGVVFQIIEFWTAKEYQHQGIGKKLLADFMAHLKQEGIRRVFLLTMRGEATEGFYRKRGFVTQEGMCCMEYDFENEKGNDT